MMKRLGLFNAIAGGHTVPLVDFLFICLMLLPSSLLATQVDDSALTIKGTAMIFNTTLSGFDPGPWGRNLDNIMAINARQKKTLTQGQKNRRACKKHGKCHKCKRNGEIRKSLCKKANEFRKLKAQKWRCKFRINKKGIKKCNKVIAKRFRGGPGPQPTSPPPTSAPFNVDPGPGLNESPSRAPSSMPSHWPTLDPSGNPSSEPSLPPSDQPTSVPSRVPSSHPTYVPSKIPSFIPSIYPTSVPSKEPSSFPSDHPSASPSSHPSIPPSPHPSTHPSEDPTLMPSLEPSTSMAPSPSWVPIGNNLLIECNLLCPSVCLARTSTGSICCSGNISSFVEAWECPIIGICGDGVINIGEECDDGNEINNDACTNSCEALICGDGKKTNPEECDNGALGNGLPSVSNCSEYCVINKPGCGNGTLEPGEECDDGNNIPGDGCSSNCLNETCGNSRVDSGEECDLGAGNQDSPGSSCTKNCTVYTPYCGDGFLNSGEECDDGNFNSLDGCSENCTLETFAPSPAPHSNFPSLLPAPGNASAPTPNPLPCSPPPQGETVPPLGLCVPPACDCSSIPEGWRFPLEVACTTVTTVFDPASLGSTVVVATELAALAPKIMCRNLQIKDLTEDPNQDPDHYECVCDRQERFCNELCICAWAIFKMGTKAGLIFLDVKYSMKEALQMCRAM